MNSSVEIDVSDTSEPICSDDCQGSVHCGLHKCPAPFRPADVAVGRRLRAHAVRKRFALDAVPVVHASRFADDNTLGGHFRFGANTVSGVRRSAVLYRTCRARFRDSEHRNTGRPTDSRVVSADPSDYDVIP